MSHQLYDKKIFLTWVVGGKSESHDFNFNLLRVWFHKKINFTDDIWRQSRYSRSFDWQHWCWRSRAWCEESQRFLWTDPLRLELCPAVSNSSLGDVDPVDVLLQWSVFVHWVAHHWFVFTVVGGKNICHFVHNSPPGDAHTDFRFLKLMSLSIKWSQNIILNKLIKNSSKYERPFDKSFLCQTYMIRTWWVYELRCFKIMETAAAKILSLASLFDSAVWGWVQPSPAAMLPFRWSLWSTSLLTSLLCSLISWYNGLKTDSRIINVINRLQHTFSLETCHTRLEGRRDEKYFL